MAATDEQLAEVLLRDSVRFDNAVMILAGSPAVEDYGFELGMDGPTPKYLLTEVDHSELIVSAKECDTTQQAADHLIESDGYSWELHDLDGGDIYTPQMMVKQFVGVTSDDVLPVGEA